MLSIVDQALRERKMREVRQSQISSAQADETD